MAIPECFEFHSEEDNYREHCDHEFNSRYDRYDGWGDPDLSDGPPWEEEPPARIPLTVIGPELQPFNDDEIPF